MRRREFIAIVGGAATWPLAVHAQQTEPMRRIGVLMGSWGGADDPEGQALLNVFLQRLQPLGWTDNRNVRIDARWAAGNADNLRKFAAELAALAPDVIFAPGGPALASMLQATRAIPIVFTAVSDPVGSGFVESLSRPGGNATGFMLHEYSLSGKWLELLKEIAPRVTRAAVLRDVGIVAGIGQFAVIQSVAPSLGVEVSPINVRDAADIERAIAAFARSNGDSGLIVPASALALTYRSLIITLAARHKLPAIYFTRPFVVSGGLISYRLLRISLWSQFDPIRSQLPAAYCSATIFNQRGSMACAHVDREQQT